MFRLPTYAMKHPRAAAIQGAANLWCLARDRGDTRAMAIYENATADLYAPFLPETPSPESLRPTFRPGAYSQVNT